MTEYKNFFELSNPLNLYNKSNSNTSNSSTDNEKLEEADKFANRLYNTLNPVLLAIEDISDSRWNKILEGRKERNKINKKDLSPIFDFSPKSIIETGDLLISLALDFLLDVGDYLNVKKFFDNLEALDIQELKDRYNYFTDEIKDLTSAYSKILSDDFKDLKDEIDLDKYKEEITNFLVNNGYNSSKEEANSTWNAMPNAEKFGITLKVIADKSLNDLDSEYFKSLDNRIDRLSFLIAKMKSSPFYRTENDKYKESLNLKAYNITKPVFGFLDKIINAGEEMAKDADNIIVKSGPLGEESIPILSIARGTLRWAGHVISIPTKIAKSLGQFLEKASYKTYGALTNSELEEFDELTTALDEEFIAKLSEMLKLQYLNLDKEAKKKLALEFDNLSRISPTYQQTVERGDRDLLNMSDYGIDASSTEDLIVDAKVQKMAEIHTRAALLGELSAKQAIDNYWKDITASNQGAIDYITNTLGTGATSFTSDVTSVAAVVANVFNPYTYKEGYTDALIKNNFLMDWALTIQDFGEEKFHTYHSVDDENAFVSWRDVPDLVGQYGFTLASKYITAGGSWAAKQGVKAISTQALKNGIRGSIARGTIWNKEVREAVKNGLRSGATREEYTKALEALNNLSSNRKYNLDLALAGIIGTGEGALNAGDTYENFQREHNPNALFDELKALIENAPLEKLHEYMVAAGYPSEKISINPEVGMVADFTPELYEQARQELLQENESRRLKALDRLEDDALDAASANFIANSFINGIANTMLKEGLLSNDVKTAIRRAKGLTKKIKDLIEITKDTKGWVARAKSAVKENTGNKWKDLARHSKELAKEYGNIGWKATKSAGGEMLEEWGQDISDMASQAAFEADLNNYVKALFDNDAYEAFNTDFSNILDAGFDAIATSATSKQALKSGLFGFLSTAIGGLKPVTGLYNAYNQAAHWKESDASAMSKLSNIANGFVESAILEAYKESKEEGESARKLAESINAWLGDEASQELITNLGGAIGFKKLLENDLIVGDSEQARDNKLGLAVENVFMLRALADTEMGKAYLLHIDDQASLSELTTEESKAQNFDSNGTIIGENNLARSAIVAFRERYNLASEMSDFDIVQRLAQNALEFKDLQEKVDNYSKKIELMYKEDNLDPVVQLTYIQALIQLEKVRSRKDNLELKLTSLFISSMNDRLTAGLKELINKKSNLDSASKAFIAEYGSVANAIKELKKLEEKINLYKVATTEKNKLDKLKSEEATDLSRKLKELEFRKKVLLTRINRELELLASKLQRQENNSTEEKNSQTLEHQELITVGDLVDMNAKLRAYIINNKTKYSEQQLKEIDKFLNLSLQLQAASTIGELNADLRVPDISLVLQDVIDDYTDLAALEYKSDAYDLHLLYYIHNPEYLLAITRDKRKELRIKTLKFIYRDDLLMRPNETSLDVIDRVLSKIEFLRQNELTREDAEILDLILREDPDLAKIAKDKKKVDINITSAIIDSGKWKDKEDIANKAIAGLRTLIVGGNLTIQEIKRLFDSSSIDKLQELISRKYNGKYLLDRLLSLVGESSILEGNSQPSTVLLPLLLDIKEVLDTYYNIKDLDDARSQPLEVTPSRQTERKHETSTLPADLKGEERKSKNENSFIKIVTPGESNDVELLHFLDVRDVSGFLAHYDNRGAGQIKFMVTKKFGKPVIFCVVQVNLQGKNIKGTEEPLTFLIGNNHYYVIGYINSGESSLLDLAALESFKSLPTNGSTLLLNNGEDIKFDINTISEPMSISREPLNLKNPPQLKSLLTDEKAVYDWVEDFVENGTSRLVTKKDAADVEHSELEVKAKGFPIFIQKVTAAKGLNPKTISLFDIKLEGLKIDGKEIATVTLGEFLDSDYTVLEKINALRSHDSFFDTLFKTWVEYGEKLVTEKEWLVPNIWNTLVSPFIYLGSPYEKRLNSLGLQLDKESGLITINNTLILGETITFTIPHDSNGNDAVRVLEFLLTIHKAVLDGKLKFHNLEFMKDVIGSDTEEKRKLVNSSKKKIEKGVMKGLILLGVLYGFIPKVVKRSISLNNPFAGNAKTTRSTSPNVVTPDNGMPELLRPKIEDNVKRELNEKLKKAQAIVDRIKLNSTTVNLTENTTEDKSEEIGISNEETSFYEGNGRQYTRVTSTESATSGYNVKPFTPLGNKKIMSTAQGNTVDTIVRKLISILNASSKTFGKEGAKELLDLLLLLKEFNGAIPNYKDSLMLMPFLQKFIDFYNICLRNEWTIVPEGIKAFGNLNVLKDGAKFGELPTAGTLDLLVYDSDGVFHIIDIKTKSDPKTINLSMEGWGILVNTYQYLLQQQYPEMEFGENYILPIHVFYSVSDVLKLTLLPDRMTVTDHTGREILSHDSPTFISSDGPINMLHLVETLEVGNVDFNKLSDALKGLIIQTNSSPTDDSSAGTADFNGKSAQEDKDTSNPESGNPLDTIAGSNLKRRPRSALGSQGKKSQRTLRQARFTDFINNHIAPVSDLKLNIFYRVIDKIKDAFGNRETQLSLLLSDLANTFFQGNIKQLKSIIGNTKITRANMPNIVKNIKKYFDTYISNELILIYKALKRQKAYKLLYDYLNGNVSELLFLDLLDNLDILSQDLPELITYINSSNKELDRLRMLLIIENSKIHTIENLEDTMKSIKDTIDAMRTKQEFLESENAITLLSERMESIKQSIEELNYSSLETVESKDSMKKLLNGENNTYGISNLLSHIKANSKNSFFRMLAAKLQDYIKQYNLIITVSVEDALTMSLEGETDDRNITIYKSSLDSYEHLERVLLHEILHTVLLVSPQMKVLLQDVIDKAIASIARNSLKSINEIKLEFYGLTNTEEFISEFFTNYAFLEMLKSIIDTEGNRVNNIILLKIANLFNNKKSTLYDSSYRAIKLILELNNLESLTRTAKEIENPSYIKHKFKNLDKEILKLIENKGISEQEFDDMTSLELQHLEECCN